MNKQTEDKIINEAGALAGLANSDQPSSGAAGSLLTQPATLTRLPSRSKPEIKRIGKPLTLGKPKSDPKPLAGKREKTIKLQTF